MKKTIEFFFFDESALRGLSPFALWIRKDCGVFWCISYDIDLNRNWPDDSSTETILALQDFTSGPLELAFLFACRMGFCEMLDCIHTGGKISRLTIESGIEAAIVCDQKSTFSLLLGYLHGGYLRDRTILTTVAAGDSKLGYFEDLLQFTRNRAITPVDF